MPRSYLPAHADSVHSHPGIAFREVKGKLYPSVGLKKTGEHVRVNFGQTPFMFDIDSVMKACSTDSPSLSFSYIPVHSLHVHCLISWPAFFISWARPITTELLRGFLILSVIQSGDTISARGDVTATRQLLFRSIGTNRRTSSFDPITHTQSLIVTRPSGACPDTLFHGDQKPGGRPRARLNQRNSIWLQSWSRWLIHTGRIVAGFFI